MLSWERRFARPRDSHFKRSYRISDATCSRNELKALLVRPPRNTWKDTIQPWFMSRKIGGNVSMVWGALVVSCPYHIACGSNTQQTSVSLEGRCTISSSSYESRGAVTSGKTDSNNEYEENYNSFLRASRRILSQLSWRGIIEIYTSSIKLLSPKE